MAINEQFISNQDPYVHSNVFNFRTQVHSMWNESSITSDIENAIKDIEKVSDLLRAEAAQFLGCGEDAVKDACERTSRSLFYADNTYTSIAMKITRDIDFVEDIRRQGAVVNTDDETLKNLVTKICKTCKVQEVALDRNIDTLVGNIFDAINKEDTKKPLRAKMDEELKQLWVRERTYITHTDNFKSELRKTIRSVSKVDKEKIWESFKKRFLELAKKEIDISHIDNKPEDWLNKFEPAFKKATDSLIATDTGNITNWLGEAFKETEWNTFNEGLTFSFLNVGSLSEKDTVDRVKEVFGKEIQKMRPHLQDRKSHSDWILMNSKGKVVRAQDKHSATIIKNLKEGMSYPQNLKLNDDIAYKTLVAHLQPYSHLTAEGWDNLGYIIANALWFSKTVNASPEEKGVKDYSTGEIWKGNITGIRDIISRILAEDIGYFIGSEINTRLDKVGDLGRGGNNTFFIIDNTILFPSYLILDEIIKQLKDEVTEFAKLQVVLGRYSAAASPAEFLRQKYTAQAANPDWHGGPYGADVLAVGKAQGQSILDTAQVRVNLKFSLQTVLTTAYNFTNEKIMSL